MAHSFYMANPVDPVDTFKKSYAIASDLAKDYEKKLDKLRKELRDFDCGLGKGLDKSAGILRKITELELVANDENLVNRYPKNKKEHYLRLLHKLGAQRLIQEHPKKAPLDTAFFRNVHKHVEAMFPKAYETKFFRWFSNSYNSISSIRTAFLDLGKKALSVIQEIFEGSKSLDNINEKPYTSHSKINDSINTSSNLGNITVIEEDDEELDKIENVAPHYNGIKNTSSNWGNITVIKKDDDKIVDEINTLGDNTPGNVGVTVDVEIDNDDEDLYCSGSETSGKFKLTEDQLHNGLKFLHRNVTITTPGKAHKNNENDGDIAPDVDFNTNSITPQ